VGVAHWDELEWTRRERGHLGGDWQSLTGARSVTVGVKRMRIDPGSWSTPAHMEGSEEEIFYVLSGSGLSWQDGAVYEVGVGDVLVHRALEAAHTLRAGPEGLEVLAFGQRHYAANTLLPRADVSWLGTTWVRAGAPEDHPWAREAAAGPPDVGTIAPRPATIVNVNDVEVSERRRGSVLSDWRDPGRAAGSERTGLQHVVVLPDALNAAPHCHSAEEEIFVVLDGDGTLELFPSPSAGSLDTTWGEREEHPVRAGSIVARPAGSRQAHAFRAGESGMTLLAYGTRDPNDIVYYPRSNKVYFRGLGLLARVEPLDYWDGEDEG
jgi:uncharacterized cupin superfamily protein